MNGGRCTDIYAAIIQQINNIQGRYWKSRKKEGREDGRKNEWMEGGLHFHGIIQYFMSII